jgi:hypothetical protein
MRKAATVGYIYINLPRQHFPTEANEHEAMLNHNNLQAINRNWNPLIKKRE